MVRSLGASHQLPVWDAEVLLLDVPVADVLHDAVRRKRRWRLRSLNGRRRRSGVFVASHYRRLGTSPSRTSRFGGNAGG
jgi:hypothetical protein